MPDPFITQQDLISYLGRGGTADPAILMAIDSACDMCRTVAEQDFNRGTSTITLDGTGTDSLLLPQLPVVSAGTVTVNGAAVTDYVLNPNGILFRGSVGANQGATWPEGRQNVTLTYAHGYTEVDMPRDVRMVAVSVAARLAVQGAVKQESIGPVSVTYGVNSTDMTSGELRILKKHRPTR